jgi:hypothetical protein
MKTGFTSGLCAFVAVGAVAAVGGNASADRRAFGFTYEYTTQGEGQVELELWNTQTREGLGDEGGFSTTEQQLEIEYGVTDKTSVSVYQVFDQATGTGLRFAATKLELRHRIAERGEWPVDIALYGAVAKPWGEAAVDFEPKLILARDFGAVTLAVNVNGEIELAEERDAAGEKSIETELVPGWAAGLTYEVVPQLKIGAETWGARRPEGDEKQVYAWAGPAVSWAPSTKFWMTGVAGFALNDRSEDLVARLLVSVGL